MQGAAGQLEGQAQESVAAMEAGASVFFSGKVLDLRFRFRIEGFGACGFWV